MRSLRKLLRVLVSASVLTVGGSVLAQGTTPPPASQPASSQAATTQPFDEPTPPAPNPSDIEIPSMSKRANISPHDMLTQATTQLEKMRTALTRIVALQEVGRKQKDVIKLNCVNDKLLQVKQLLNIAEEADTNLQEAIARNDEEARYHEFSRITIAAQQVSVLTTEAEDCVGTWDLLPGAAQIEVSEPEQPDDPTIQPQPDFPVVDLPPLASPFV
jgi:hypothetical protein